MNVTLTPLVIAGWNKVRPVYGPGNQDFSCTAKITTAGTAGDYAQLKSW